MNFKVNLEGIIIISKKDALEWYGTIDPKKVAEEEEKDLVAELGGYKFIQKKKVTVEPIS